MFGLSFQQISYKTGLRKIQGNFYLQIASRLKEVTKEIPLITQKVWNELISEVFHHK